ncbi:MAG TPA: hypothetical protein PK950_01210 [Candidatus Paceibacterota bacterium]|nr:hypothetical protein [Candidatus Paceibacterota bacterium]
MMFFLRKNKIIRLIFSFTLIVVMAMPILASAQGGLFGTDPNSTGTNDPNDVAGNSLTNPFTVQQGSGTTTTPTNAVACSKNFRDFPKIIDYVTCTITRSIIPLLFALALLMFIWGVLKYVIAPDGSDDREEGRWFMIWGIVGLFVMVSVWGLVGLVSNTLEIGTAFPPQFR